METRRRRRVEDHRDEERIQTELIENLIQNSDEVGSRDFIVISEDDQCLMNPDNEVIKQEIKTELEDEVERESGEVGEFENDLSQVKFEIDEPTVVVNEEEIICSDEDNKDVGDISVESFNEGTHIISEHQSENGHDQILDLKKLLPLLADHLEIDDILICRRVNKNWREIVDDFLHDEISEEPFDNEKHQIKMRRSSNEELEENKYFRIKGAYCFLDPNRLEKFIERMGKHCDLDHTPFVGHAKVVLCNTIQETGCATSSEKRKSSNNAYWLIHRLGKYIVGLQIQEEKIACFNKKFFVKAVQMCLENCPNLNSFSVETIPDDNDGVGAFETFLWPWDDIVNPNVLNMPKKLCSFSIDLDEGYDGDPKLSDFLMEKLVNPFFADQLQNLGIDWSKKLKLKMPHLKELNIFIRSEQAEKNEIDFDRLFSGKWLEAPIEKFCLEDTSASPEINIIGILTMLKNFPTIRYLKLDFLISGTPIIKNLVSVQAQNIHTLELTEFYGDDKMPDEFLRAFPKLRFLKMAIHYNLEYKVMSRSSVSSDGGYMRVYRDKLISVYDTEIWEVARDLEKVVILCRMHKCNFLPCFSYKSCDAKYVVGTRKGYQQHCEELAQEV